MAGENEYIECPFCGEEIKQKAIKCKHCHSMLNTENHEKERQQTQKVIEHEPAEKSKKPTKMSNSASLGYTILVVSISLFIIPIFVLLYQGCQGRTQETTKAYEVKPVEREAEEAERQTLAWRMAVIGEDGGYVPFDGTLEREYQWYLTKLEGKTIQNEEGVADITVKAWQMLREDVNPNEHLLDVLKELHHSIPRGAEDIDLTEVASIYVILRMSE